MFLQVGPQEELMPPLIDRDRGGAQAQAALLDPSGGGDPDEGLPGTAWEDDDARPVQYYITVYTAACEKKRAETWY